MNKIKQLYTKLRIILCCALLTSTSYVFAEPDDPLGQLLRQRQMDTPQNQSTPAPSNTTTTRFNVQHTPKPASTSFTPTPVANNYGDANALVSSAMGFIGVAYRFGGTTPRGFDCSGFMQYVFRKAFAVNLPRVSAEQAKVGVHVSRNNLQPGDMVFFRTAGKRISHVGMYVGGNRFIHAPRTGKRIEITSLGNQYWSARYATARRVKRNNAQNFIR